MDKKLVLCTWSGLSGFLITIRKTQTAKFFDIDKWISHNTSTVTIFGSNPNITNVS